MKFYISLFLPILILASCNNRKDQVFHLLDPEDSGISFTNTITESDSINILDLEYVYNGGGVAIADYNNDGLQDIFFTGNMTGNKLYLNDGKMHFTDVTESAKLQAAGRWSTGVAAVDINNDGLMDLYVGASIKNDASLRANMLFINKGADAEGKPVFADEAVAYNVADTGHTTNAAFFDYDNDGDLDLYILTNKVGEDRYPNQYKKKRIDGSAENTDRLYRNDWDSLKGHPVFTNVSREAGILIEGYGLGLNITDINKDGWKDIYVTNDFLSNDILWINNQNGTFTNLAAEYFKHTSYSAMGNDVVDINNDGLVDVIAVDMLPASNYRKKMMMAANNYQSNINNEEFNYQYQYVRNTLQLNQGMAIDSNNKLTHPVFSDIAFMAGVAETDWSWAPLVTDFDNDGFRDMIITNGYPKDITDRDFMTYRVSASKIAPKNMLLEQIPEVKLHNYAFRNNGNSTFSEVSEEWGLGDPTFSSGAAYGDLDNDGDMDLVINNTNQVSMVYENRTDHDNEKSNNYLQLKFEGSAQNRDGIGAWVELYYGKGKMQVYEHTPYRGYLSSMQNIAHFGLGEFSQIDSLRVKWWDGSSQLLQNVATKHLLKLKQSDAKQSSFPIEQPIAQSLFKDITAETGLSYIHQEHDFTDFNIQKLLPHKLSEYGPALAVGDIDGNGTDDIIAGGSYSYSAMKLVQGIDGKFVSSPLLPGADGTTKAWEDMGLLLFDADGDGDPDLYTTSGSYENEPNSRFYQDKFYLNDGTGGFTIDSTAIPQNFTSKSCVRAIDYDKDGDLDLFVAGRVAPWNYPKPVSSFIWRNDTKNGKASFTDVTAQIASGLKNVGLVCDAIFTDFDNDGWTDLILAGEWMPLKFFRNEQGKFNDVSSKSGINDKTGFWNSITGGDFDGDGDIDYIAGNMGLNSFYRANEKHPVRIYAKDFDNNESYDAIPTVYLPGKDGKLKEYPAQTRDDLIKQIISLRGKFQNYNLFADATIDKLFTPEDLKTALVLNANYLESAFIRNNGKGVFEIVALPTAAQVAPIKGMVAEDFDGDGALDIVMNGNDYGTEVSVGRYDAFNGLYMKGDGKGGFSPMQISRSGFYIPGNGKSLVKLRKQGGATLLAAAQNRGPVKIFEWKNAPKWIPVEPGDNYAELTYQNGRKQKMELHYGSSFLSQSGRFINAGKNLKEIKMVNAKGNNRIVSF
ncbi:VCBS repeat-containing protein [Flavihumibacter sediminis]|nr:VCBS repeat-containing protein [Flavihumibacter sediminis]